MQPSLTTDFSGKEDSGQVWSTVCPQNSLNLPDFWVVASVCDRGPAGSLGPSLRLAMLTWGQLNVVGSGSADHPDRAWASMFACSRGRWRGPAWRDNPAIWAASRGCGATWWLEGWVQSPLLLCTREAGAQRWVATTLGAPQGPCLVSAALPEPVDMKTVRLRVPVGHEGGQGSGALAMLFWVH